MGLGTHTGAFPCCTALPGPKGTADALPSSPGLTLPRGISALAGNPPCSSPGTLGPLCPESCLSPPQGHLCLRHFSKCSSATHPLCPVAVTVKAPAAGVVGASPRRTPGPGTRSGAAGEHASQAWPLGQEGREGQRGGRQRGLPIRKHFLSRLPPSLLAGRAAAYALQLTKNSLKNNHFLLPRDRGDASSCTCTRASLWLRSAFQDLPFLRVVGGSGTGPRQQRGSTPRPAALRRPPRSLQERRGASLSLGLPGRRHNPSSGFLRVPASPPRDGLCGHRPDPAPSAGGRLRQS